MPPTANDPIFTTPVSATFSPPAPAGSTQVAFADIDHDGDLDLFMGLVGGSTVFYRNTGTARAALWDEEASNFGLGSAGFKASPFLVDIDGDGDLDAFIGGNDGATRFYRNTGTTTAPQFAMETANFGLSDVGSSASLAFVDIDGDFDQDAFIGNSNGVTIFFRNAGNAATPAFTAEGLDFGITDVGFSATPRFADIDGDGDMDALVGNSVGVLQVFRNTGSATAPSFTSEPTGFGLTNVGHHASPAPVDIDADGDLDVFIATADNTVQYFQNTAAGITLTITGGGTAVAEGGLTDRYTLVLNSAPTTTVTIALDTTNQQLRTSVSSLTFTALNWNIPQTVLVRANDDAQGEGPHSSAILHSVTSADAAYSGLVLAPVTVQIADNDLPAREPVLGALAASNFGLTEVGASSRPAFGDIDADGDMDALVGMKSGAVSFYRNTGTSQAPTFALDNTPLGLAASAFSGPAIVDIDGDGDLDAFVAGSDGSIAFYRNAGTAQIPGFSAEDGNFGIGAAGTSASITFVDIDGDGDQDAFVGARDGSISYYRNVGSQTQPSFVKQSTSLGLNNNGIVVNNTFGSARATFGDFDGDGDTDALVGAADGQTLLFRNSGSATTPTFALDTSLSLPDIGFYAVPSLVDIDGDGDLDVFIGTSDGLTRLVLNNTPGVQVTQSAGGTAAAEGGSGDSFSVALKTAPLGEVRITLSTSGPQLASDASILLFTPANWNVAQTVSVRATDDAQGEGAHSAAVMQTVSSTDAAYNGLVVPPVTVQIADNDQPLRLPQFGAPSDTPLGLTTLGASATITFADMDADGDPDAFVGIADGSSLFLRNSGSASAPAFSIEANSFGLTDPQHGDYAAPALVDIDGDGDLDAYVGFQDGTVRFFRNSGSATSPAFTREASGDLALVGGYAEPTFADVDGDGDMDAFVGVYGPRNLNFFRNEGSAQRPHLVAEDGALGVATLQRFPSPRLVDLNGDGLQDLLIPADLGGVPAILINIGTQTTPQFEAIMDDLGLNFAGQYSRPSFVDLDADGDLDAVAGNIGGDLTSHINVNAPGLLIRQSDGATAVAEGGATDSYSLQLRTAPTASVTVTLNTTNHQVSASTTTLTFTTSNWAVPQTVTLSAVDDMLGETSGDGVVRHGVTSIDTSYDGLSVPALQVVVADNDRPAGIPAFGTAEGNPFNLYSTSGRAAPVLVDIDADGDLDAFIGDASGVTAFYLNTGSATAPNYAAQQGALGLVDIGESAHPVFGDLDGDGDLDAVVGKVDGVVQIFQNAGSATAAMFTPLAEDLNLGTPDANATPALVDIDGDGDLDVFIGQANGNISFFLNSGSRSAPQFGVQEGNFGLGSVGASASLAFADIDGDGDPDALVGNQDGETRVYFNIGSARSPSFLASGSTLGLTDVSYAATPSFADIDADGDLDVLVGNLLGGTHLFRAESSLTLNQPVALELVDSARDDSFAVLGRQLKATGADGAAVSYDFVGGGTVNGATTSKTVAYGVLVLNRGTGALSFTADDAAAEALGSTVSTEIGISASDGSSTVTQSLTLRVVQSGTTESSGNDVLGGTAADERFDGLGGNDSIVALAGHDTLLGGLGDDTLEGGSGNDSLVGGDGNDTYQVDSTADSVTETNAVTLTGGTDRVFSSVNWTLSANVENLYLTGSGSLTGTGNALANYLEGNAGAANYLAGGAGADTMAGGDGNDTYYVDDATDVVIETNALSAGGVDTVLATVTYSIGSNLENLLLSGLAAITGVGNASANYIEGSAAANFLSGGAGTDTLKGGDGNDTYYVDDATDVVIEDSALAGSGTDTVVSTVTTTLGANLENLLLTSISAITGIGNSAANYIEGSAAANFLSGEGGADTMKGQDGNDTYYVDNVGDVVIETNADLVSGGTDTVSSTVTYTLGANLENLLLNGLAAITGGGNAANNYIEGSAAANFLSGGAGVDTMKGNDGNDTYYVDNAGDVVIETNALAAGGTDTVASTVTYTLGANLENLLLTSLAAITGVGNAANNYIEGSAAANFLSGEGGADTLKGNDGNDTYYVDNLADVVIETNALPAGGTDTVVSSVTTTLGANLENLLLTGAGSLTGVGNAANNYIEGNAAVNFISGAAGADTMKGNDGNDTYYVDNAGDVVIETNAVLGTGGRDTVSSSITYVLGANLEDLLLTGNAAINGFGNTLANYLLGNAVANSLVGGDGNDTLVGAGGTDALSGGLNVDLFDFNALADSAVGTGRDVVSDFSNAQGDRIDLADIDANSNLANDQAFSFIGSAAFTSVAGQLRYSGNILSGDTNGDGTADFEIQLTGVASLFSTDIVL